MTSLCSLERKLESQAQRVKKEGEKFEAMQRALGEQIATREKRLRAKYDRQKRQLDLELERKLARKPCEPQKRKPRSATKKATKKPPGVLLRRKWTALETPSGRFAVRLRVVEVDDVVTSHLPANWAIDPRYPAETQERRYDHDFSEQQKVTKMSRDLRPSILLTNSPSAMDGPPVVFFQNHLLSLGGNGRSMGTRLAYDRGNKTYKQELNKLLRSQRVRQMKRPILVRELVDLHDKPLSWWTRELNRGLGSGLDLTAKGVSLARSLPTSVIWILAGKNLAEALSGEPGRKVVNALQRAGLLGRTERGLFEGAGLSKTGKALVRRALVGAVIPNPDIIDALSPVLREKIARAAPSLLMAKDIGGPDYDLTDVVAAIVPEARSASKAGVKKWLRSSHLVKPETLKYPTGPVLMEMLAATKTTPGNDFVEFANEWFERAQLNPKGQTSLSPDLRTQKEKIAAIRSKLKRG